MTKAGRILPLTAMLSVLSLSSGLAVGLGAPPGGLGAPLPLPLQRSRAAGRKAPQDDHNHKHYRDCNHCEDHYVGKDYYVGIMLELC